MDVTKMMPRPEVIETLDWLDDTKYPPYYANKDYEVRWKKKPYLQGPIKNGEQLIVSCTDFNGVRTKIDGHSRSAAWRAHIDGEKTALEVPPQLKLMVYKVNSQEEVAALYRAFNSKDAAETPNEQMQHYNRLNEYKPTSLFMRSQWKSVYNMLEPTFLKREHLVIDKYKKELQILDSWEVPFKSKSNMLSAGIRAAMVRSVQADPELAKKFWFTYLDEEDLSVAEVNRLREEVASYKGKLGGARVVGAIFGMARGQFETFVDKHK